MLRGFVGVILAALLTTSGAACGAGRENGSRDPAAPGITTQPTSGTTRTTIYSLIDGGAAPIGVRRTIRTKSPYAREALNALLAGPTPEEQENGITTAIPDGTRLLSMTYKRHGADETVNLTGLPPRDTTGRDADGTHHHPDRAHADRHLRHRADLARSDRRPGVSPGGMGDRGRPVRLRRPPGLGIRRGLSRNKAVLCDHFVALRSPRHHPATLPARLPARSSGAQSATVRDIRLNAL